MAMNPNVTIVEPLDGHKLRLVFANGETRVFDMTPYLDKGSFAQLKDASYFRKARVAFGAVSWPNEQDLSKDTLYLLGTPA
jgi:hypothetical protein